MAIHRDLPDAELHEPKGIVSAQPGTVLVANGQGSGVWSYAQALHSSVTSPRLTSLGGSVEQVLLALLDRIRALEAETTP